MPPYIFFARHGETEANRLHYLQSRTIDEPLNETGILQAKNLGGRLKNKGVGLMVISPSKRTVETASFIMDAISPPYVSDVINPDFLEINSGSLDGFYYDELKQKQPDLFNAWWGIAYPYAKHRHPFPDGENFFQIKNRGKSAVEGLRYAVKLNFRQNNNILIVGHGSMNSVIIALLLGINPESFLGALYFENCSLIKIDMGYLNSGRARLIID